MFILRTYFCTQPFVSQAHLSTPPKQGKLSYSYTRGIIYSYNTSLTLACYSVLGNLRVEVIQAQGLPVRSRSGLLRRKTFMGICYEGRVKRTSTKTGCSPGFNSIFDFDVRDVTSDLCLRLFQTHNLQSPDCLGQITLPLPLLMSCPQVPNTTPIEEFPKRLLLQIWATDLVSLDMFSKSDPIVVLSDVETSKELGRTENIDNQDSVGFEYPIVFRPTGPQQKLRFSVYDMDREETDDKQLIGYIETTALQLSEWAISETTAESAEGPGHHRTVSERVASRSRSNSQTIFTLALKSDEVKIDKKLKANGAKLSFKTIKHTDQAIKDSEGKGGKLYQWSSSNWFHIFPPTSNFNSWSQGVYQFKNPYNENK